MPERLRDLAFLLLVGLFAGSGAHAGDWRMTPDLTVQEVYTDNVTLAPSGVKDDDVVTEISPRITIDGETRKLELHLDYQLQGLLYAEDGDRNSENHLLQAIANIELLENRVFVDLNSRLRPQNISNQGRVSVDNISAVEDRRDVLYYDVSPYWRERVDGLAETEVRFTYDKVDAGSGTDTDAVAGSNLDSEAMTYFASIENGWRFTRLLWNAHYRYQDLQQSGSRRRDTVFETVQGQFKYLLTRTFALQAAIGHDDHRYDSAGGDTSGMLWNVGFTWTPSPRTNLEATVGERYFGRDVSVNARHRMRRLELVVSYDEEPSTTRRSLIDQQVFPVLDEFGGEIVDPTLDPLDPNVSTQTAEVQIRKSFDGSLRYRLPKHLLEIGGFITKRDFQLTQDREEIDGARARWVWQFAPYSNAALGAFWSTEDIRTGRQDEFFTINLNFSHSLSPTLEASLGTRYIERTSDLNEAEYDEFRVFATVNKVF